MGFLKRNEQVKKEETMIENKILQFPKQTPDVREVMLDGKLETMLSARGVLLVCLSAWKLDGNERAHDGLRRYCEYISVRGCPGGASKALKELDGLGKGAELHGSGARLPDT